MTEKLTNSNEKIDEFSFYILSSSSRSGDGEEARVVGEKG